MAEHNIRNYGARGDGTSNDAAAIQRTIDACAAAGGGRVVVPSGATFLSGTITLKDCVELHIERGATLLGSPNPADYTVRLAVGALTGGALREDAPGMGMLITADGAQHVAISGGGIIDGNGRAFIATAGEHIHIMRPWRPFTLFLLGCHDLLFRDITIRDGALWTLRLSGCDNALIDGIQIDNDLLLPNNDGIDLDRCRNIRIQGCHISTGDDAICLKTCEETAAWGDCCENIVVSGCTLRTRSSALVIGCEAKSAIRNVIFDSCVITDSNRGLAIHLSEEADVEHVIFSNMIVHTRLFHEKWWGHGEPIYVVALPWDEQRGIGRIRHVRFQNIMARSEHGALIYGWQPGQIEDLVLDNVRLTLDSWSGWQDARQDLRPCPGAQLPLLPTHAITLHHARDVSIRNVDVAWGEQRPPYFERAFAADTAEDVRVENLRGGDAHERS
ncbi:glycoside hydrolase family 28 protein [Candidatus Gracilibacteria bacterium]|nr:glycoside hydrolase family 28 protein [Candidatus Gracilibacteria bacterium]